MNFFRQILALVVVVTLSATHFFPVMPAAAQGMSSSTTDQTAHEIFTEVLSPYCPGRSLQDCPSGAATDLKREVRQRLAAGVSKETIIESLYETYGSQIRSVPAAKGFGLLAWLMPFAFLAVGFLAIFVWIRKTKTAGTTATSSPTLTTTAALPSKLSTQELAKVRKELE